MSYVVPAPQLTPKAIVLSLILTMVLAGANAYLGLFAGLTVSASIPAAVISMAVLRLFAESNILENNIVQTAASSGEALAAGVIFTMPALVLLGYWSTFDYWWVSVIAGVGGLLGVLFTIPLRRSLIFGEKLAFPEGVATAEVLKVGESASGVRYLAWAAVTGAAVKLAETGLRLWAGTAQAAGFAGNTILYIGTNLSPALLSVGFIVGLNISVLVFIGGAISWFVAIPLYSALFAASDPDLAAAIAAGTPAGDVAFTIWSAKIRYLGVGAMLVGGIWALIKMRRSLAAGIKSGLARGEDRPASGEYDHTQHDAPMRLVLGLAAILVVPLFAVYQTIVGSLGVALAMTAIMVVAGFLFSAVAAYMAGLVGSSNNPISGVTIATILFASLLLLFLMGRSEVGPAAAILVGAVVCCAAAIGGDNLQDLKAGALVGATPWRQQVMQCVGVLAAVLVMAPILNLLLAAYGIGPPTPEHPNSLNAPQATLMASVARGVFGGGLPWSWVAAGALIGTAIVLADEILERRGSAWRMPVLAVAIGIYLPLELATPILIGGLIAYFAAQSRLADASTARHGMLFAAGLITGEALIGIFMALPIVLTGNPDVIALPFAVPQVVGLAVVAVVATALYRVAAGSR